MERMIKRKLLNILLMIGLIVLIVACGKQKTEDKNDGKIKITTTLNYFVNLAEEIGKEKVIVTGLMQQGEDPHLYVATAGDVEKLEKADLVIYGGLHLEGKMEDIFKKLSNKNILNLGEQLDINKLTKEDENTYDPHVWFNTEFWAIQAKAVAKKLTEMQPENKEYFENNLRTYLKELDEATVYVQERISEIPKKSRYLITAHDAFGYFAEQFGLEVKAIQGVSTDSEIGTKEIENLANFIVQNDIKAIFVESSVNHRSIEALQEAVKSKGKMVVIGGELYSDSMGDKENNTETYIKTLKANADIIANALK